MIPSAGDSIKIVTTKRKGALKRKMIFIPILRVFIQTKDPLCVTKNNNRNFYSEKSQIFLNSA